MLENFKIGNYCGTCLGNPCKCASNSFLHSVSESNLTIEEIQEYNLLTHRDRTKPFLEHDNKRLKELTEKKFKNQDPFSR
jgi:hypothetical protein